MANVDGTKESKKNCSCWRYVICSSTFCQVFDLGEMQMKQDVDVV